MKGQRGHGDEVAFTDEYPVTDSTGWSICLLLEEWTVTYSVYYPVASRNVNHVSRFAPHFDPWFPSFARRKT